MIRTVHQHTISAHLDQLRPTQCTIGFTEVNSKVTQWKEMPAKKRKAMLSEHWFPCVLGPNAEPYIVDHHHLGMALHQVGEHKVSLLVLKDFSMLAEAMFWRIMEFHQWVHPYNELGKRVPFSKIPRTVPQLKDDPYRSLAGCVRLKGGFAKDTTPFSEFLWADHFRTRIPSSLVKKQFDKALGEGMRMASSLSASYLPGWVGDSTSHDK
jgi:hypothetical protein